METNHSRRNFLRNSALIAGGAIVMPTIIPSCVLKNSPNGKVVLGHIGVGGRGSDLLANFLPLNQFSQSVAICDTFGDRLEKVKASVDGFYAKLKGVEKYNGCDTYADFQEMLERKDIDGVVIASPDHWHVALAIAAVKAGKDVYVEKPLGMSIEQGQTLRKLVHEKKAVFQYGTQQRSDPRFRQACEITRNGLIGKLERIDTWCEGNYHILKDCTYGIKPANFDYNRWLGPAAEKEFCPERVENYGVYFTYDYALGFIAGWGAHPLDIAQWGNNSDDTCPTKITGTGTLFEAGHLYDTINEWDLKCEYENGVSMAFMSTTIAKDRINYRKFELHGTTFVGTEGWVSVDRAGIYASNPEWLKKEFGESDIQLYKSDHHQKNFVDCIKSRKDTASTIDSAVQSDAISHLSDILIRSGQTEINWNPKEEKLINPTPEMEKLMHREMRAPWAI
jgi:hypothetical protein